MTFKPSRLPLAMLLCAALLTLLCLLWIRTRWNSSILGLFTPSGHLQAIATDQDGLLLFFSDVPFGREAAWSADYMSVSADEFQDAHALLYGASKTKKPHESHFAGFRYVRDQFSPTPNIAWWYRAVTIPYWSLIVLLAILPLQRLQRWVIRHRRVRRGQCPVCGYDLRGSVDRCPECGRSVHVARESHGLVPRYALWSISVVVLVLLAGELWRLITFIPSGRPLVHICPVGDLIRADLQETQGAAAHHLHSVIADLVAPLSWSENGGDEGALYSIGDWLIVVQTPEVQSSVQNVLGPL